MFWLLMRTELLELIRERTAGNDGELDQIFQTKADATKALISRMAQSPRPDESHAKVLDAQSQVRRDHSKHRRDAHAFIARGLARADCRVPRRVCEHALTARRAAPEVAARKRAVRPREQPHRAGDAPASRCERAGQRRGGEGDGGHADASGEWSRCMP